MAKEEEDLFEGEESLSRPELREKFKECTEPIPGTGGKKLPPKERASLEKKVFGPKYGGRISEKDWEGGLRELKISGRRTVDPAERRKTTGRYRLLKKIGPK